MDLTIQLSTLYTRYRGENVSFYDHSRDNNRSRGFKDDDSDSDSSLIDDDDDDDEGKEEEDTEKDTFKSIVPAQVDYEEFLNGLSRIDREFNRHREFISRTLQAIAKVGGFWWLDALALSLG